MKKLIHRFRVLLVLFPIVGFPNQALSQELKTNSLKMELRSIPAGEFDMGFNHSGGFEELMTDFPRSITPRDIAGEERPIHRVRISKAFEMGAHEVTIGQFRQFCEATGYRTTGETSGAGSVGFAPVGVEQATQTGKQRTFSQRPEFTWRSPGFAQNESHPVVGVSWEDANAFCRWLSKKEGTTYRLPTEAEWEYVCRAGNSNWFSFGDAFRGRIQQHANVADFTLEHKHPGLVMRQWLVDPQKDPGDAFAFTAPVGSFQANAWGVYDLHGNVWEWCQDRYLAKLYQRRAVKTGTSIDPLNLESQDDLDDWRVIRGGAWSTGPLLCRAQARGFFGSSSAACYIGFRVVCELPPSKQQTGN
ncbi:Serine/threonine-protein kinase pkn1 [Gimesia alba]|uniref:Serine/threonine-protein kinase pkn1 n=1 Tax=Gimesia alba TaxID=2527973 RepID=A0A517RMW6_9PLAN|nr:formylglycine-generating enzyme family protein [Gimesia alba]QDT45225.1 Serine/threonine-protein kinase pkn1 [Gimesia alba]